MSSRGVDRGAGRWAFWLVLGLVSVLAGTAVAVVGPTAPDDAFINYRYAENLAAGRGLVFNPGERVFGTTEPGLTLLLGLLHLATGVAVPWLGTLVTGAALIATTLLLAAEAKGTEAKLERLVASCLVVCASYLWIHAGLGAPLAVALLVAAACGSGRREGVGGALAGLAVWCRPDALLGAGAVALLLLVERRRTPWRFVLSTGSVVGAGLLLAWLYFGSPLPETLDAKAASAAAAQRTEGETLWQERAAFWSPFVATLRRHAGPLSLLPLGLGLLGLAPFWRRAGRGGRTLVLFALGLAVAYPLLEVPFFSWYAIPLLLPLYYGLPALAFAVARLLVPPRRRPGPALRRAIALVLVLPLAASLLLGSVRRLRGPLVPAHVEAYRLAGEWLREHSAGRATLSQTEVGAVAFYSDRHVFDLMGLVTRSARPYVEVGDFFGAFLAHPADFLVVAEERRRMEGLVAVPAIGRAYRQVASLDYAGGRRRVRIYERNSDVRLPPRRPPRRPPQR